MSSDSGLHSCAVSSTNIENVAGEQYHYMSGFGNEFCTEVIPGAIPIGRNTPRLVPYNLYTEQLSGTAFTAPRSKNRRTWLYRIQPSVTLIGNNGVTKRLHEYFGRCNPSDCEPTVDPIRWKRPMKSSKSAPAIPRSMVEQPQRNVDFVQGMQLMCHGGDVSTRNGIAIYMYWNVTQSMSNRHLQNADGDFLIVPCTGKLIINTELGRLTVSPTEIAVIPRGMIFSVHPDLETRSSEGAMGYVLEVYTCAGGSSFQLPNLGPIGSNGLANVRDFYVPVAWCPFDEMNEYNTPCTVITKKDSELFSKEVSHSPYNVVGWHGNYVPYKYPLLRFCAVNSVTYDHLDPSIFTVLTCPSGVASGTALADFVVFPSQRVLATDSNTFRPPWFHRNVMSEYMGLICGSYDAKKEGSFVPGGASLHNSLTPHGPDEESYSKAVLDPCATPTVYHGGLAFMFETCLSLKVAPAALHDDAWRDAMYMADAWGHGLSAEKFSGWDALRKNQCN